MEIRDVIDEDEAGLDGRGGEVGLPPELWQCVFDWVGTWKGLGSVSRVCRAFHDLALLQIKRRRLAFETRLAEGDLRWKRVACVGTPAPDLRLEELRGEDEDEEQRDYFAHSLTLLYRQPHELLRDMEGPLLARYGGSFYMGGNVYDMIFSPAMFFYKFGKASWHRVDLVAKEGAWAPKRRSFASTHLINKGTQILFFGGQYRNRFSLPLDGHPEGWKFYNDAFLFDLRQLAWIPLACKGTPPHGRVGHRSVVIERKMWIFGGTYMDADFTYHYFDDVWTLDLDTLQWTKEQVTGEAPQARQSHSLCRIPNTTQALLWGGNAEVLSSKRDLNDCYILDTAAKTWTKVEYANKDSDAVPCGRWCHSSFIVGRSLVVMGGFRRADPKLTLRQIWVLNIDRREWRKHDVPLHPSVFGDLPQAERRSMLERSVSFQGAAMGIEQIYLFGGTKDHGLWILE